ncbi:L-aspartate oxidase [bacterium]|nr:L-aspartate oxidase [bacterium]
MAQQEYTTDILIIGSGIAGLVTALKCSHFANVTIITKALLTESNTRYAQGGIAVALNKEDSPKKHFEDTMKAGCFHNNPAIVELLTKEGPAILQELLDEGLEFDKKYHLLDFVQEAAHSIPRVLHNKDQTGNHIITYLSKKVREAKNITLLENSQVIKLNTLDNTCYGCVALSEKKSVISIKSIVTCLTTGGIGQLFKHTSNPQIATGDGLLLGYDAGCQLIDIEFMQFHPTSICTNHNLTTYFLLSEAIRGEGAKLKNHHGDEFMHHYHPEKELAPRDIVSRGIFDQLQKGNEVFLDCRHLGAMIKEKFPTIETIISLQNLSLSNDLIPVSPTAHYMMGGILTNKDSLTSVKQLYAIGEVACNGVHGANRLASNSLLDGLVFAKRAADHIKDNHHTYESPSSTIMPVPYTHYNKNAEETLTMVQSLLWSTCGIIRNTSTLTKSLQSIEHYLESLQTKSQPMRSFQYAQLAQLIITASLHRTESLGSHFINPTNNQRKYPYWITQQKNSPLLYHDSFPSPCSNNVSLSSASKSF